MIYTFCFKCAQCHIQDKHVWLLAVQLAQVSKSIKATCVTDGSETIQGILLANRTGPKIPHSNWIDNNCILPSAFNP